MQTLPKSQTLQRLSRWGIFGALANIFVTAIPLSPASAQVTAPQNTQNARPVHATLNVQAGGRGKKISTDLMGIFFEDINYSADGGLYAELIQNRSFEYSNRDRREWNSLTAWELVQRGDAKGRVGVESAISLHPNNPNYALLTVEQGEGTVGLTNSGFDGIPIKAGERYNFSCFARRQSGESSPLVVTLESKTGTVYGTASFANLTKDWVKYSATIQANSTDADARLFIGTQSVGAVALDMISLFPAKTFNNRSNGLRADLAQTISDLKPKFVRFPGGCVAHGDGINNIYRWKDTIGPIETRKNLRNIWGYHQSVGLGYFEYFQFCEDIGAKPLPVVAAGVSCQNSFQQWGVGQQCIPIANMGEYIQDVLDLVEWANGPVTSYWGAKRAAAGHPKPFNLQYLGIGNEDHITPEFRERFTMIYKAVKAKYPKLELIGTVGPASEGPDYDKGWQIANDLKLEMVDEHYYSSPEWFLSNLNRYDSYSRSQSKVYLGEYASRGNSLFNALAEAAYLTSLERNGDIVHLASYAPLLAKTGRTQWAPDLIYFDNTRISPSVNYYVQQLYGHHSGDTYLPTTLSLNLPTPAPKPVSAFVGTWNTQAQFQNARLESGPNSTLDPAPTSENWNWSQPSGKWEINEGTVSQTGEGQPALYKLPTAQVQSATSYTLSLRARKTGGREGFLIGFGATDASNYYWWNIGGWNNTQHGIQRFRSVGSTMVGKAVPGNIETGRWYDIKIVVNGPHIQCFLDGRLIHDLHDTSKPAEETMAASTVRDTKTGDIILKLVNVTPMIVPSKINLSGLGNIKPIATRIVLSGDLKGVNSFEKPQNIVPQTSQITVGNSFQYEAPPHSFTVIRIKTR